MALFPLIWINADDQGRLSGHPEEIKYTCCPNVDDITKADISTLLQELDENELIKVYKSSVTQVIQILDWWEVQRLQWAWPSQYPAMGNWTDHLRYKKDAKTVVIEHWPPSGETSNIPQVSDEQLPGENSGERSTQRFLTTPNEKERGRGRGRGRGKSPETSGEHPPPSPDSLTTDINKISNKLLESFQHWFGHVKASDPYTIIPREPGGKELAQLRDFALEISAAGGCPLSWIKEAFREASGQEVKSKRSVSYVRAILFDWLGIPRSPPE